MLEEEKNTDNQDDTNKEVSANLETTSATEETVSSVDENAVVTTVEEVTAAPVNTEISVEEAAALKEQRETETTKTLETLIEDNSKFLETAHDDFDWDGKESDLSEYSETELKSLTTEYENYIVALAESQIVDGKVKEINGRDVIIDFDYKADGILSISEFRDMPDLKVGDLVPVYVESLEDKRGQLSLSRRKAKILKAWDSLVDSYETGAIVNGTVVSKTKGGLIVDCSGLETFLPGSQIDIRPIVDYDAYVGKTMEFRVVKINEAIKNAVVSHKALIESDLAEQRDKIVATLERGQVLEGVVKNITDFGAFMDLGGVDGLLYITDISWGRIKHPSEVLELNQKLNVVVLDFNEDKKRISLSLKQLLPHPWEVLDEKIVEGSTIKGKVVNIEDYGAFLEVIPGVEGLVHVSEVTWSNQPVNAKEYFTLGESYDAKVVTVDREDKKMSLSIKQLSEDPWNTIENKFATGTKHTGVVKNLTPYGVFVELDEGIGGMIHISDLSWLKRFSHPSEFTKVGQDIDIQILEIDKANRKLSLGHKQLEENPWDTFENVFPVGSFHEGTLVRKDEKGAIVQLQYGLEAFAPLKHVKKENGSMAEVNDVLTFKVLEFNRDDKRILISHTRYLDAIKREAGEIVENEKREEKATTRKFVKKQAASNEVTTLGEIAGFGDLKKQLEAEAKKAEPVVKKVEAEVKKVEPVVKKVEAEVKKAEPVVKKVEAVKKVEPVVTRVESTEESKPAVVRRVVRRVEEATAADDLKKIEGIGPKIEEVINKAGVTTYKQLSETKPETIKEWLKEAGGRFAAHNPGTWPKQAEMAAEGKWDELKKWQDELDGGK